MAPRTSDAGDAPAAMPYVPCPITYYPLTYYPLLSHSAAAIA
jgi:hypothetical protein